ncbi:MAG: gliding motility protein GldL [Muribaculaceae bacterium]|nr:gliding motility protein GldL [Muribaculaceae bacterium]
MAAKEKINRIERFLRGEKGQRFFNFAYSIGAAIVIWGALFKILHLPGGSALLCIGMGTEIAMFIITAFDRPSKEYEWEQVFPELGRKRDANASAEGEELEGDEAYPSGAARFGGGGGVFIGGSGVAGGSAEAGEISGVPGGGVIVAGGSGLDISEDDTHSLRESISKMAAAADQLSQMAELTSATQDYLERIAGIADQMSRLQETTSELNRVSEILLDSYRAITDNSTSISESSSGYVESMADLNRNISGLNTIYEIQLKSISSQLESIDRVNRGLKDIRDMYEKSARQSSRYCEETERMTRYMTQLNSVYEKMVTAMTINMYNPMMGQQQPRHEDDFNPYGSNGQQRAADNYNQENS